mgnify:FL=1
MSDTEMDENCATSNLQPISDVERDINCDAFVKISKKEMTKADRERIIRNKFQAFQVQRKKKYKKQKKYVMDPLTKRYKCHQCEKDYTKKCKLLDHVQIVHEGLPIKCKHCPKTFNSKPGLYFHMKSVHEGVAYQCEQCHKSFTQKYFLKQHVRIKHTHPK